MFIRRKVLKQQLAEALSRLTEQESVNAGLSQRVTAYEAREQELCAMREEAQGNIALSEKTAADAAAAAELTIREAGQKAEGILSDARMRAEDAVTKGNQQAQNLMDATMYRTQQLSEKAAAEAEDTLARASTEAENITLKARTEAAETLSKARQEAEVLLSSARQEAETTVAAARTEALAILDKAKRESSMLLANTEETVRQYEQTIADYNAQLEATAQEAAAQARRLAAFSKSGKIGPTGLTEETEGMHFIPVGDAVELEDAGDDPALVMKNIYRLQHRTRPAGDKNDLEPLFAGMQPSLSPEKTGVMEVEQATTAESVQETAPEVPCVPVSEEDLEPLPTVDGVSGATEQAVSDLDGLIDEILSTVQAGNLK